VKTDGATTEVGLLGNVVTTWGFSVDVNVGGANVNVGGAKVGVGLRGVVTRGSFTVDVNVMKIDVCDATTEVPGRQVAVTVNTDGIVAGGGQSIICRTTKVTTPFDGISVGTIKVPITRCEK